MDDHDLDLFTRGNPEAHKLYLKARKRNIWKKRLDAIRHVWGYISKAILWIAAVGGFILGLLNRLGI